MDVKSLIPFRNRQSLVPPDLYVFGSLQREVDRLFDEFARGFGAVGSSGNGSTVLTYSSFTFTIPAAQNSPAGTYTDTLTVTLTP